LIDKEADEMQREDDFQARRAHLADLSDEALYERFWDLTEQVVDPLIDLAKWNTSPGVEQAVVLRMGFSSLESKEVVAKCVEHGLLKKGAGNCIYRLAQKRNMNTREAGLTLIGDENELAWKELKGILQSAARD
jgi:D-ornithine 4,5-aminomutase subunit alpha